MFKYLRGRWLAWLYRRRDRATVRALRLYLQERGQPLP